MTPDALATWLRIRLGSEAAYEDWRRLLQATFEHALDEPLETWLPQAELLEAVEAHLGPDELERGARFVLREVVARAVVDGRQGDEPLERWLSAPSRQRLLDFVARPGLIDRAWVERLFEEEAMEALVSDTLYRALRDFSTIVPRIVQGVLPSKLGKLAKLGGRATGGVGGRMFEEVERKLEAEIKRFLEKGTRPALERASNFAVERLDSPESELARRDLVEFALSKPARFHLGALSDEVLAELETLVVAVARDVAAREELSGIVERVVGRFYDERGRQPLREALAASGLDGSYPFDAWARVSWPAVSHLFEIPAIQAFIGQLAEEILAEVQRSPEV